MKHTTIKGYELHERIGAGGFGEVYRAFQSTIGREVAIKIILPKYANHPDFIRRFESEAQIVARLAHPFIVPLHDAWRDLDGAYLVMRWLRGGSLHGSIKDGPLDLPVVCQVMEHVMSALSWAHRQGVVHRDLKPSNILLDEDGNAYLADFGIAKDFMGIDHHTQSGEFIGSAGYAAPEQARGDPVSPRTDIYSLGVVLYELLTGQHPFPNLAPVELFYKHLNEPIPIAKNLSPDIADDLNELIQKATAKNPTHRYPDIEALIADFRHTTRQDQPLSDTNVVEMLTQREQDILKLLIEGQSNKEIAAELFIAPGTVKWYNNQIFKKLNVMNRVQAIVRARELDLISTPNQPIDSAPDLTYIPTGEFHPENPYKGLKAFQAADNRDFFGREKITAKLIDRLRENDPFKRFLAIIGPSGSGKSSLVKAGLIPALWRGDLKGSDQWYSIEMRPTAYPFDELEVALTKVAANLSENLHEQLTRDQRGLVRVGQLILPDDNTELLIIIDQFEEVFTLVEDEAMRTQFLDLLTTAVTDASSRVRIVVTLRADFYDRPLQYPKFAELVRSRMETVLPLSAEELERAIVQPAERVGVNFEDGLVATISDEVAYQPGALPLLQYALTELFEKRDGRMLTHEAYLQIGGAGGALAKRADDLYLQLDTVGQETIRQLFLRLVTLGEGTEDTRRRTPRSELLAITDDIDLMDDIIDTYADYRLLSLDHDPATRTPTVEVAHEAILREWERLRTWLNESRDDIKTQRQVANLASEWNSHQRDESFLVRGRRLEQFQLWSLTTKLFMTPREMDFLSASLATHEAREAETEAQVMREKHLERRAYDRLRIIVAVLLVASAFGISLTIGIFLQRQSAIKSRDDARDAQVDAEREAKISQSVALAASAQEALLRNDTDLAIALALESNSIDNPPLQAWQALTDAVYAPGTRHVFSGHEGPVSSVAMSPDGRYIAAGGGRRLDYEYAGGTQFDQLPIEDYSVRVFDTVTGDEVRRFDGHTDAVWYVKFSVDSDLVYSVSRDNTLRVWSMNTGDQVREFANGLDSLITRQRFGAISTDEQLAVIASNNKRIIIMDTVNGNTVADLEVSTDTANRQAGVQPVWKAAFSPDGRFILVGSGEYGIHSHEGELRYLDVNSGQSIWGNMLDGPVHAIAFDPSGQQALIGTYEPVPATFGAFPATSIIILIDVRTGERLRTYRHGYGPVTDLAFTPDGGVGVSVAADQVVKVWDIQTGELIETLTGHEGWITDLDFSSTGRQIVTSSEDGTVRLWDIRHGAEYKRFEGHIAPVHDVTTSPNGDFIVSGSLDRTLIEWDIASETIIRRLRGHDNGGIRQVILIADGYTIISGALDGSIRFWNVESGEMIDQIIPDLRVVCLAVSPDERYLIVSVSVEGSVTPNSTQLQVWDITTGIERFTIQTNNILPILRVAVAPDGRSIISVSEDGTISVWELATGQLLKHYDANAGVIHGVAISPDGRTALFGTENRTIIMWNIETGQEIRRFEGHNLEIYTVAISPDGKTALSGSADRTLILWDTETGEVLRRFNGHQQRVITVRFSPDGQYGFSGGESGDVVMWRLFDTTASVLAWAEENRYIRSLTCEEREFFNAFTKCGQQGEIPGRQFYPTLTPLNIPSQTPTLNLTQTTATPTWTPLPTFTPAATRTLVPTDAPIAFGHLSPGVSTIGNVTTNATSIWTFDGQQDQHATIQFNTFGKTLRIFDPEGNLLIESQDARIGPVTLPTTGTYQIAIEATPVTGSYTLTLSLE